MKILTGELRGRLIRLVPSEKMRPTSDIARKAICDAIQGLPEDKRVLDLFSGTGALGFEALSGGAKEVVWVDAERSQAEAIEKTLSDLGLSARGQVYCSDAMKAIETLGRRGQVFDLFFLDPPYHAGLGQKAVKLISEVGIFSEGAVLVLETHKTEDPAEVIGRFRTLRTKRHGDTKITYYRAAAAL